MTSSPIPSDLTDERARDLDAKRCADIAARFLERHWAVCENFVAAEQVAALAREASQLRAAGRFRPAGIGRGRAQEVRPEVRGDEILWLEPPALSAAQTRYLAQLEQLRLALNRALLLGLFDFEGHLAVYAPGSYYRKHRDRFRGTAQRLVTVILYLNQDWHGQDGGELRLFLDESGAGEYVDIAPRGGTLVCFLSEAFYHEVLPTRRPRLSITGWFRARG